MTTRQQFEKLWGKGCKDAVLAIVENKGEPLSSEQLQSQIDMAVSKGFISHAFVLAEVAEATLTQEQADTLVRRCIELGWVSDAISVPREVHISEVVRKELIEALIKAGEAATPEEAEGLLHPEPL